MLFLDQTNSFRLEFKLGSPNEFGIFVARVSICEEDVPKVSSAKSVLRVQKGRLWQAENVESVVPLRLDGLLACCLCWCLLRSPITSLTGRCLGLARFRILKTIRSCQVLVSAGKQKHRYESVYES